MADNGKLTHADVKLQVFRGCTKISPGCLRCWAITEAFRAACRGSELFQNLLRTLPNNQLDWSGLIVFDRNELRKVGCHSGANIWVAPSSDPFHEDIPLSAIAEVYAEAVRHPTNNLQFLTKRVERMRQVYLDGTLREAVEELVGHRVEWPLKNTWEGTSIENEDVVERARILLATPSNFRYLSMQPLLGRVNVGRQLQRSKEKVRFAILGGEAGPDCRPFDRYALADVRNQLVSLGVKCSTQCYPI